MERLPKKNQSKTRTLGLSLALVARLAMLFGAVAIVKMRDAVLFGLSFRDLLMFGGAGFLIYKAVSEMHKTIELKDHDEKATGVGASVIFQIVLLDIVFSLDSVITAIGMTDQMWVIVASVIISFAIVLVFAKQIGRFILSNPALKILALSFLITIGVTLFLEGMHKEVPRGYIYLPMGFALFVELLQFRYFKNNKR